MPRRTLINYEPVTVLLRGITTNSYGEEVEAYTPVLPDISGHVQPASGRITTAGDQQIGVGGLEAVPHTHEVYLTDFVRPQTHRLIIGGRTFNIVATFDWKTYCLAYLIEAV